MGRRMHLLGLRVGIQHASFLSQHPCLEFGVNSDLNHVSFRDAGPPLQGQASTARQGIRNMALGPASSPQKLYLADRFCDFEQYLAKSRTINNTDFSSADSAKTICTNLRGTKAFSESCVTARPLKWGFWM